MLMKTFQYLYTSSIGVSKDVSTNLRNICVDVNIDFHKIIKVTKDYSGANVIIVCRKEA
jgi:hypothetical protein